MYSEVKLNIKMESQETLIIMFWTSPAVKIKVNQFKKLHTKIICYLTSPENSEVVTVL